MPSSFKAQHTENFIFQEGKKCIFFNMFTLLKLVSSCLINKDLMIASGIAMALLVIVSLTLHCCINKLMTSVTNINGSQY